MATDDDRVRKCRGEKGGELTAASLQVERMAGKELKLVGLVERSLQRLRRARLEWPEMPTLRV